MIKKSMQYVIGYLMWVITLVIGAWFGIISWEGFQSLLTLFYVRNSPTYAARANFYRIVFFIVIGLLWGLLMIISEESYRKGVLAGNLTQRVAIIIGPLLLLSFLADTVLLLVTGIQNSFWLRWLIVLVELAAGIGLVYYARTAKIRRHKKNEQGN
jgi:signal transduction histidine kinase